MLTTLCFGVSLSLPLPDLGFHTGNSLAAPVLVVADDEDDVVTDDEGDGLAAAADDEDEDVLTLPLGVLDCKVCFVDVDGLVSPLCGGSIFGSANCFMGEYG